jgi:nuclear pore complex protein Nup85
MPEDGRGAGPVAEELLDWVNRADLGPTTEEGEEILGSRTPWEHEEFWTYLIRSALALSLSSRLVQTRSQRWSLASISLSLSLTRSLLRGFLVSASQLILSLSSHPSPILSKHAPRLSSLVESCPRSSSPIYTTDRAFLTAHASWQSQLANVLRPLSIPDWGSEGDWETEEGEGARLEEDLQSMIEVLEGEEKRIIKESVDWKEALGAWGLWIRPSLTRDDIPDTIAQILTDLPSDPNLQEEQIELSLLQGEITQTITLCNNFNLWLVTHLTDLLEKLALVEAPLPEHPRSLRTHFLLEYAEHLGTDPGLWMMVCDYLSGCGKEGLRRIAVVLERIALEAVGEDGKEEEGIDEEKMAEVFK